MVGLSTVCFSVSGCWPKAGKPKKDRDSTSNRAKDMRDGKKSGWCRLPVSTICLAGEFLCPIWHLSRRYRKARGGPSQLASESIPQSLPSSAPTSPRSITLPPKASPSSMAPAMPRPSSAVSNRSTSPSPRYCAQTARKETPRCSQRSGWSFFPCDSHFASERVGSAPGTSRVIVRTGRCAIGAPSPHAPRLAHK